MHRHQYKGRKLSRKKGPRKALLRNLTSQLILHEKIITTIEKAKEVRPIIEKLITKAKKDTLVARRLVAKFLSYNDLALKKLFEELGPLYKERNGGYSRIVKIGPRKGDGAMMAQISLLDTDLLTKKAAELKSSDNEKEKPKNIREKLETGKAKSQKTTQKKKTRSLKKEN